MLRAATFISPVEGLRDADYVGAVQHTHEELADELIDILLDRFRPRGDEVGH